MPFAIADGTTPSRVVGVATDGGVRISARPPAFGTRAVQTAQFRRAAQSYGNFAAGSTLFSMRWADPTRVCLVQQVLFGLYTTTAVSIPVAFDAALYIARDFSISDVGGGDRTLGQTNSKLRTSLSPSVLASMQDVNGSLITTTSGARTVDTTPIGYLMGYAATANTWVFANGASGKHKQASGFFDLFIRSKTDEHPIVLAQNDGLVIQNPLTAPADGAFTMMCAVKYIEQKA